MRKTSQDGGDTSSITSGVESESKKIGTSIIKTTRNSIKRKVQNFSHETDDTVIEPLLQKEKVDNHNQSAKYLLSKTKTDSIGEKENEKDKLLSDVKLEKPSLSNVPGITDGVPGGREKSILNTSSVNINNHMNTNVFGGQEGKRNVVSTKAQILVEIDAGKQYAYNPSPVIFTTAKIHTDSKTRHMEPVHVTPVPILTTIEGGIVKAGTVNLDEVKNSALREIESVHNMYSGTDKTAIKGFKLPSVFKTDDILVSSNKDIVTLSTSGNQLEGQLSQEISKNDKIPTIYSEIDKVKSLYSVSDFKTESSEKVQDTNKTSFSQSTHPSLTESKNKLNMSTKPLEPGVSDKNKFMDTSFNEEDRNRKPTSLNTVSANKDTASIHDVNKNMRDINKISKDSQTLVTKLSAVPENSRTDSSCVVKGFQKISVKEHQSNIKTDVLPSTSINMKDSTKVPQILETNKLKDNKDVSPSPTLNNMNTINQIPTAVKPMTNTSTSSTTLPTTSKLLDKTTSKPVTTTTCITKTNVTDNEITSMAAKSTNTKPTTAGAIKASTAQTAAHTSSTTTSVSPATVTTFVASLTKSQAVSTKPKISTAPSTSSATVSNIRKITASTASTITTASTSSTITTTTAQSSKPATKLTTMTASNIVPVGKTSLLTKTSTVSSQPKQDISSKGKEKSSLSSEKPSTNKKSQSNSSEPGNKVKDFKA